MGFEAELAVYHTVSQHLLDSLFRKIVRIAISERWHSLIGT